MRHSQQTRRGAVLWHDDKLWLMWKPDAVRPVVMPVIVHNVPRTRDDYVLQAGEVPGLGARRLMIRTNAAAPRETHGWAVLGHLPDASLAAVVAMMSRAAETTVVERRYQHVGRDVAPLHVGGMLDSSPLRMMPPGAPRRAHAGHR
ncbi:MAG: hypothetical protein NVSMB20_05330 [Bradyrhizobium sp.]